MAQTQTLDLNTLSDQQKTLYRDYSEDLLAHDSAIRDFDAYEAMANSKTYDSVSRETKNELTDSMTATIYLERAARVAGQLPEGEVQAFGKRDYGKGLFMDLLRTKWIYPNANAQHPFRTKMFMWQYGSSQYGYMPMYYDLNVSPSGYFGPDCWLWNPRNFIPQNGFSSVSDMDYVHALAYKSPSWFDDLLDEADDSGWNKDVIKSLKPSLKQKTRDTDPMRDTTKRRNENGQQMRQVCVATRYEAGDGGRWITFLPDFSYQIIRSVENPHKNGRIPFVIKPCIPTFDSFYGVGDFQRSMPMQFANDGLDNFYFQGIKINLFPPIIVNTQNVVRHTIRPGQPASVWEETEANSIRRLDTSTAGLATYTSAKGMAKGAVQSIAGTTDTRANAADASDPGFGKTPEALKQIADRESTRDNQDRQNLEEAMTELIDGMLTLIPLISTKIPIDLFAQEIQEIGSQHPDLTDIFTRTRDSGLIKYRLSQSKKQMRVVLDPTKLNGLEYRFQLTPNSTAKKTKESQLTSFESFFDFLGKVPNALQQYQQTTGKVPNWEWIFGKFGELSDIDDMKKAFIQAPQQPQAPQAPQPVNVGGQQFNDPELAAHAQDLMGMLQR